MRCTKALPVFCLSERRANHLEELLLKLLVHVYYVLSDIRVIGIMPEMMHTLPGVKPGASASAGSKEDGSGSVVILTSPRGE